MKKSLKQDMNMMAGSSTLNPMDKGVCTTNVMGEIQTWHLVLVTYIISYIILTCNRDAQKMSCYSIVLYEGNKAALLGSPSS